MNLGEEKRQRARLTRKLSNHELVKEFIEEITQQIGTNRKVSEVIIELMNRGIIKEKSIRNYLIIRKFPEALRSNDNHCHAATTYLSRKYGISSRTVYHILKEKRNDY